MSPGLMRRDSGDPANEAYLSKPIFIIIIIIIIALYGFSFTNI